MFRALDTYQSIKSNFGFCVVYTQKDRAALWLKHEYDKRIYFLKRVR